MTWAETGDADRSKKTTKYEPLSVFPTANLSLPGIYSFLVTSSNGINIISYQGSWRMFGILNQDL